MKLLEFLFLLLNCVTRKVSSYLISCNKRISSVFFAQIELRKKNWIVILRCSFFS